MNSMEPLTALSLAGNVIQFIDFSSKLFSQGCELYKSTEGRLAVDDEIQLITAELRGLISKIQSSNATKSSTHSSSAFPVNTSAESNLERICCEAEKIAENILTKLEHRKLDSSRNRKLESFRVVWMQIWTQRT
jgi:phosphate uptake regulator